MPPEYTTIKTKPETHRVFRMAAAALAVTLVDFLELLASGSKRAFDAILSVKDLGK